jgi:TolA-binding protein
MQRAAPVMGLALCAALSASARAEAPPSAPVPGASTPASESVLDGYMRLLAQKKLAGPSAQSARELSDAVQAAQQALLLGRRDECMSILLEAVEGPRFRDFEGLDEFHAAELLLVSELLEEHALKSAQRILDRMLARGIDLAAFGPAYRRAVDVALARGDLDASAGHLEKSVTGALPEDASNELHYLKGRAAYDRGAFPEANRELTQLTLKSRFYPSAQYLLGAIAAKGKNYKEAEARFCKIATAGKNDAFSFYVDGRFYPVRDMAHLALGRVAHETSRANDAFYYYFQVPHDSERVAEALFEASWASYEGGDHDAALDGLDQLKARYPNSAYSAEAAVLRGYVHLSRCEFGAAEAQLIAFEQQFGAVLREIDGTLESEARRKTVYRDLVARAESVERRRAEGSEAAPDPDSVLLALVSADPEFYRLHSEIRALDAELARSGNVPSELSALRERLSSKETPSPSLEEVTPSERISGLTRALADARGAVDALELDLRSLERAGAARQEIDALRALRRKLDGRLSKLDDGLRDALREEAVAQSTPASSDLVARLAEDRLYVEQVQLAAQRVRAELEAAADRAGERALRDLRDRLAAELRRAGIGRIDAVMGSKRQVELQIESLSAGRFPPELVDPLRMQMLLRDDEEYWPFEGEDWPDEFVERYSKEEEP